MADLRAHETLISMGSSWNKLSCRNVGWIGLYKDYWASMFLTYIENVKRLKWSQ